MNEQCHGIIHRKMPELLTVWVFLSFLARRLPPLRRGMNGGALSGFDAREKHDSFVSRFVVQYQ
jgi:hypothetical protein